MTAAAGVLVRPVAPVGLGRLLGAAMAAALVAASLGQVARVLETDPPATPPSAAVPAASAAQETLGALPLAWVANTGQSDPSVRFMAQGLGYGAFLTDSEAVLRLDDTVLRLAFDAAQPSPAVSTEAPLAATVSSFTGSDPDQWQAAAPTAAVVRYEELWPGIDATFRGSGSQLEWDYHVAAGADPTTAGVTVTGAHRIEIDGDRASLVIGDSELPLAIPAVWQTTSDGTRIERTAHWDLDGDTLRVIPDTWDPSLPGVIDPTLVWSTFLGGGHGGDGGEFPSAIAVDSSGSAYITGYTGSTDFPTTAGAFDPDHTGGSSDVFVTKLDPSGSSLVYSTLLGGSGSEFSGGIAVDSAGNAYVSGGTADATTDFPTTAGAFDTTHNGGVDAFLTKLNTTGTALAYSTFLGGAGSDKGNGVAVDSAGNAAVVGSTEVAAPGHPTTAGAFDTTYNGGTGTDAFVTMVDPSGGTLAYSTLLGGGGSDTGTAIAIDGAGRAYVTGSAPAQGAAFPTTAGAYDTTHNGDGDAFVTAFNAAGTALVYSTLLGGPQIDGGLGIAVDSTGAAHVTGQARLGYPTTPGAFDTSPDSGGDAFVSKLDPSGSTLAYSTVVGGTGAQEGAAIAVDGAGNAFLTGETSTTSSSFPTTVGAFDTTLSAGCCSDAFATVINPTGSGLVYSTLLGGGATEDGTGIAVDAAGNAYVTGANADSVACCYPTTAGAYDTTHNGGTDAFVTKLNPTGSALVFSTFVGGSPGQGVDGASAVAVDSSGVYVTGTTSSNEFPTTAGAFDTSPNGGSDVFVAKLDTAGSALIYATLLGSPGNDTGSGIAVDSVGRAHVTGSTATFGFPTTAGAFDQTFNGGDNDAFVSRLDAAGGTLAYSTVLGGSGDDQGLGIALDSAGAAYLTGLTTDGLGFDYPTTPGAFDVTFNGGPWDAFVTKVDPSGGALAYSTLFGGIGLDTGHGIAVDGAGAAYVTGTANGGVPTTALAYDAVPGSTEGFATKFDPSGGSLAYSSYLGGGNFDGGYAVAVDAAGNAYYTGYTWSADYPTTPGAYDTTFNGAFADAFVTKLNPTGTAAPYSTFLGRGLDEAGRSIAVDGAGNAHVAGETASIGFPTTTDAVDTSHNGLNDAFASKLNAAGSELVYSTFLGGTGNDLGKGIAVASGGRFVVVGQTASPGVPATPGAFDTTNPYGATAGFVTMVDLIPFVGQNGCKGAVNRGAEIGQFPAMPGAQSSLRVSCLFDSAVGSPTYMVSSAFTAHDFDNAVFHNGAARSVTTAGSVPAGSTSFTVTNATGLGGWVNRSVAVNGVAAGTMLPARSFVTGVAGSVVSLNQATAAVIPAGTVLRIDNSSARSTNDIATTSGSATLTSGGKANFTAADVGCSVSGQFIPEGTTITGHTSSTVVTMSANATGTAATAAEQTVTVCGSVLSSTTRTVGDAVRTTTNRVETVAGRNQPSDIGLPVYGTGIAPGAYITAVSGAGNKNLTLGPGNPVTVSATPGTITIGDPTPTAPASTDTAANLALGLDLNPALVNGSGSCAANRPEGLVWVGAWRNPGSFATPAFGGTPPTGVRVIGQILFDTSASDFAAYVTQRPALSAGDPTAADHYDIVFPNLPLSGALCPSSSSPGLAISLGVLGQTASQAALPPGTGRPGTAQLRSLKPSTTGYATTAHLISDDPAVTFSPPADFSRLCAYPATPTIDFNCGNG